RLIDNATLRAQLASLERRVSPAGHETVSHPQVASAHDDCATAVCGALSISARPGYDRSLRAFDPNYVDPDAPAQQQPVASADQRLHDLYHGIDFGFQYGFPPWGQR